MARTAEDTLKFGVTVGFAAILMDAAIAHGLFWENDPYWTYWITKTFLITTVFTFGSALLGIGLGQGLVLTAAHTLVLEVYYEWLAPVGLPQEPEWLDFNHLWTTGVPAHYLSMFAGYLLAWWVWRRTHEIHWERPYGDAPATLAVLTLAGAIGIIVVDGVITQWLLLQSWPGVTFFVQRLLIAFVFLFAWSVLVGLDVRGLVTGGIMLALVWTTYSMYLGPQGLPTRAPTYLGYNDLWLKSFPGAAVSSIAALWLLVGLRIPTRRTIAAAILMAAVLMSAASAQEPRPRTGGLEARATASGDGVLVRGDNPVDMKSTVPMNGTIAVRTTEKGNRWSHVQNIDDIDVTARFTSDGTQYEVLIDRAIPRHPMGRYTTWFGVVYEHEMHGHTGIGTDQLPLMKPEIALWGWARVTRNGEVLATAAPAHVMVMTKGPMTGVMLEVDTEDKGLPGVHNGYVTAMWHHVDAIEMPKSEQRQRMAFGWAAMLIAVFGFGWLAITDGIETARKPR